MPGYEKTSIVIRGSTIGDRRLRTTEKQTLVGEVFISANNALHSAFALPFAALNSLHSLLGNDFCSSVVAAFSTWLINRATRPGSPITATATPKPRAPGAIRRVGPSSLRGLRVSPATTRHRWRLTMVDGARSWGCGGSSTPHLSAAASNAPSTDVASPPRHQGTVERRCGGTVAFTRRRRRSGVKGGSGGGELEGTVGVCEPEIDSFRAFTKRRLSGTEAASGAVDPIASRAKHQAPSLPAGGP
jgi:hypothetical protein